MAVYIKGQKLGNRRESRLRQNTAKGSFLQRQEEMRSTKGFLRDCALSCKSSFVAIKSVNINVQSGLIAVLPSSCQGSSRLFVFLSLFSKFSPWCGVISKFFWKLESGFCLVCLYFII